MREVQLSTVEREARALMPGHEIVRGPRYQLPAELKRAARRREYTVVSPVWLDPDHPGQVYAIVQRHRAHRKPVPRWVKVAGGMVAVGGSVGYAVAWVLRTLTEAVSQAGPVLGLFLGIAFALLVVAYARRPRVIEGTFRAVIK